MLRKILILALSVAALTLLGYVLYLWATYISKVVDTGQAYGLSIGDTKSSTFKKLPGTFKQIGAGDQQIFIEIQAGDALARNLGVLSGRHVMVQPKLDAAGYADLSGRNQWIFYIGPDYNDFLRLTFCERKLCRIYRHRSYFELP